MSIEEIRQFEASSRKLYAVEVLHQQGLLTDQDMATVAEAAAEIRAGRLTIAATVRWLNSKEGVHVSDSSVRNYLLSLS